MPRRNFARIVCLSSLVCAGLSPRVADARAQVSGIAERQVRTVDLPEVQPPLRLKIAPGLKAVAPLRFPIERLTNVERHVFVEADRSRVVRRLVIVQYERAQAGSKFRFVYPSTPPQPFGAATYRFGAYVYDDERAAAAAPDREAARTRARLRQLGYRLPKLERTARLARVADAAGLSEVIVFYMENADAEYPNGLIGADEDGDLALDPPAAAALLERMRSAVSVVAG